MHQITFDQSGNTEIIDGTVIFGGNNFWDKKKSQYSERNLSGTDVTNSTGNTIVNGLLIIKGVSYTHGVNLREWLRTKPVFMENTFTIATNHADIDLGKGKGVTVTGVNFTKTNDKVVFNYEKPGVYTIKFPYRFIRT